MDSLFHIQGPAIDNSPSSSQLAPLFLIHAVSGFGLPYLNLGPLSSTSSKQQHYNRERPIYGLSSPIYQYKSYLPGLSFRKIAEEYVQRIRVVRPHGPYILGGWSMGGVISMKMAEILQNQNEEVLQVILIDAINPEGYPAFDDQAEREDLINHTFATYAPQLGLMGLDEFDEASENGSDMIDGDDLEDDEVDISHYLPRMRIHIANSLDLMARAGQGGLLSQPINCPVSLIKCTRLSTLPSFMSPARKKAIEFRHADKRRGWTCDQLECLEIETEHDMCFASENVPFLTETLRNILGRLNV